MYRMSDLNETSEKRCIGKVYEILVKIHAALIKFDMPKVSSFKSKKLDMIIHVILMKMCSVCVYDKVVRLYGLCIHRQIK
jgi:hypothetical protein